MIASFARRGNTSHLRLTFQNASSATPGDLGRAFALQHPSAKGAQAASIKMSWVKRRARNAWLAATTRARRRCCPLRAWPARLGSTLTRLGPWYASGAYSASTPQLARRSVVAAQLANTLPKKDRTAAAADRGHCRIRVAARSWAGGGSERKGAWCVTHRPQSHSGAPSAAPGNSKVLKWECASGEEQRNEKLNHLEFLALTLLASPCRPSQMPPRQVPSLQRHELL